MFLLVTIRQPRKFDFWWWVSSLISVFSQHSLCINFPSFGAFSLWHSSTLYFMSYLPLVTLITWIFIFHIIRLMGSVVNIECTLLAKGLTTFWTNKWTCIWMCGTVWLEHFLVGKTFSTLFTAETLQLSLISKPTAVA